MNRCKRNLFVIHYSLFVIHYSLFTIHYNLCLPLLFANRKYSIITAMTDKHGIKCDGERIVAGLIGLLLACFMAVRLWRWFSGVGIHKTVWGAIAGRPIIRGRGCWDYGFWELFPDGQLAAGAMFVLVASLILGALWNRRQLYIVAGGGVFVGYMVNAYLMVKLMAAY